MVLLKKDKEQQLNELTMIVTGIRLFNKASETGQEETDLHELSTSSEHTDIKAGCYEKCYTHNRIATEDLRGK